MLNSGLDSSEISLTSLLQIPVIIRLHERQSIFSDRNLRDCCPNNLPSILELMFLAISCGWHFDGKVCATATDYNKPFSFSKTKNWLLIEQ
jgi:hypothetical protein